MSYGIVFINLICIVKTVKAMMEFVFNLNLIECRKVHFSCQLHFKPYNLFLKLSWQTFH
jgi:hypothetical protein